MADFFFVLKMFIFSIALILVMQVKIGPMSLEERSYIILQSSMVTHQLQKVADGGVKAYRKVEGVVSDFYVRNFGNREARKNAAAHVKSLKLEMRRKAAHAEMSEDIQPETGASPADRRSPASDEEEGQD